ncbi:hypothetical protein C465_06171 [Halorubrum distributum JCM 9100]|uniref:Uncharacterized protein n=3 Tax=Halorubrum distributum TaxID=29283 RepID=M0EQP0_9EURY|nr:MULTISPECIES: hypothetical protein [Halorubrum distributum group]ELZ50111.1 hypothetical protein C465_06171 [Halorubrum distributum JCM 9100]ELZ54462.1 hypothetical protein C466_06062 [Halorubrum distributum JCM 10118]MDV7350083.1 hypothetical protein [Halorubrum distributum]MYL16861.1 hypothetical protein [Halorubrum terrestre]MYL66215.1 hypothetical protein [Halorubrum terrestre]
MERERAVDRLETLVDRVASEPMPVPVREVWAFGDVALGLDPVERLDVYLTKDVIMGGDADAAADFEAEYGVKGVGTTVDAQWAEAHPDRVRTSDNGYAAPEKCLAAELVQDDMPIHLEVCNAGFEDNVRQRLKGALARDAYEEVLDPRGVCLWVDGERDDEAFDRLREASLAMPTLPAALGMLGADEDAANEAADVLKQQRAEQEGASVRGDMV